MTTASRNRAAALRGLIQKLLAGKLELPPGWVANRESWNLANGSYVIHLDLQFSNDNFARYSGICLQPVMPELQFRNFYHALRVPPRRRIKVDDNFDVDDVAARVNKSLKTYIPVLDQYMIVYQAKKAEVEAAKNEKDRLVRETKEALGPLPEGCGVEILSGGVYCLRFMTNDLKKVAAAVKALR